MITETEIIQAALAASLPLPASNAAPATLCEECKVHEALPRRVQIIVNCALKAVRYCAVCQEKYFEKLPLNREQRRQVTRQLRLTMKRQARKAKAKRAALRCARG